jgi:hypothetical protein
MSLRIESLEFDVAIISLMKVLIYFYLRQLEWNWDFTANTEVSNLLRTIMAGVAEDVSLIAWRLRKRLRI